MKLSDHLPEAVNRAIERARRDRAGGEHGPYVMTFVESTSADPFFYAVLDAARFARDDPEGFAKYLTSGHADPHDWQYAKLLPKRLRPTRSEPREKNENQETDQTD